MRHVRVFLVPICLVLVIGWLGCKEAQEEQAAPISKPAVQETKEMVTVEETLDVVEKAGESAVEAGKGLLEGMKGEMAEKVSEVVDPSATGEVQAVAEKAEVPSAEESKDVTEDETEKAKKGIADKIGGLETD